MKENADKVTKLMGIQITKLIGMQQKRGAEKLTKLTGEQYQIGLRDSKKGCRKGDQIDGVSCHKIHCGAGKRGAEKVTKIDWGQVTKVIMGQPKKVPKR